MQGICAISSCGSPLGKGEVSGGLLLCASCRHALAGRLSRLSDLYVATEHALEASRHHPAGPMRRIRPQAGIRLDELTVSVRGDTVRVLSSWCKLVVDERPAAGPRGIEVPRLTSFLRTHLRWLAVHAAAADFAEEIADLVADMTKILNPAQVRTIDLGPCSNGGCGQMVRASIGSASQSAATRVRCDAGHVWRPREWLRLRPQFDQADPAMARQVLT